MGMKPIIALVFARILHRGESVAQPKTKRLDWLLLALQASHQGMTPLQLQKSLFLLSERRRKAVGDKFYHFTAYNYGPFCQEIYHDANALAAEGFVEIDGSQGRSLRRYSLTVEGAKLADKVRPKLDPDGVAYLTDVVKWAQTLSFSSLVRAVYEAYPDMRKNSVFQDQ